MGRVVRSYTAEFKLAALSRWRSGESVQSVALDVGVRVDQLYRWRGKLQSGGPEGLRRRGRPWPGLGSLNAPDASPERRIAELERQLGRQALELDFLDGALQRIEASRRPKDGPGGTASTPRSRR